MTEINFRIEIDGTFYEDEEKLLPRDEVEESFRERLRAEWEPLDEGDELSIDVEVSYD